MAKAETTKQRPGRPLTYSEPRRRLTLELPQRLVMLTDAAAERAGLNRTQFVERILAQHLGATESEAS